MFMKKVKNVLRKAQLLTIDEFLNWLAVGGIHSLLAFYFGVPKWHAFLGNYYGRPYKKAVVNKMNEFNFNTVVEIGCGLGDIIIRINAPKKTGIDNDSSVIRMAKFLRKKDTEFIVGGFDAVKSLKETEIDCIIIVNLLHRFSIDQIKGELSEILKYKRVKYFVVDEILDHAKDQFAFKGYHHNFAEYLGEKWEECDIAVDPENTRIIKCVRYINLN